MAKIIYYRNDKESIMKPQKILRCPICWELLEESDLGKTYKCRNGHNIDVARQGYINLSKGGKGGVYSSKELFHSRRDIYESGFFYILQKGIGELIGKYVGKQGACIADLGCGEGSLLHYLVGQFPEHNYIGVDISKEAIKLAAARDKTIQWIVGDLCELPLREKTLDCIIDMLTPANYSEFDRVLKQTGYIVKIFPNEDYLKELRTALGMPAKKEGNVKEYFRDRYKICEEKVIRYEFNCSEQIKKKLLVMTPLTNKVDIEAVTLLTDKVTVDLTVVLGKSN